MSQPWRVRDALRALSGRPDRRWPAGAVHHGARVVVLFGLAFLVQLLFPVAPVPDFPVLEKGMVAEEDIIARVGFPIYKSEEELAREREEAAAAVPPVFYYDSAAVDTMLARVDRFLARVDSAAEAPGGETAARGHLRDVLRAYGFPVTDTALDLLLSDRQRGLLRTSLDRAIRRELPSGIASTADLDEARAPQVRLRRGTGERLLPRDSLLTAPRFYERAGSHIPRGADPDLHEQQRLVLIRFFEPSVRLDRPATEAARARARQAVPEIKGEVLKGEKVIGAHEPVRDAELERLQAYQNHLARIGALDPGAAGLRSTGAFLYNLFVLGIFGLLLLFYRPGVYHDARHVLLVAFLVAAFVAAAALIAGAEAPVELIPIAFPALVVAALWDGRMALNLSLVLAVLLSGQAPFVGFAAIFTLVMGGAAAALSVRVVRRRAQTWVFVSIIAAAYLAAGITLGLLRARPAGEILWSAGWGTLNAIVSAIFAMGFLPLFEAFTRITTDQTLLELSDLNRPLLQRLQREAPGTFSHSLSVANLAEAAARAIGANALLTRVGIYYHDVGKMVKPQYFVENQPQGRNPHDKLKPGTSASIVRNHVLEGLRLADEYKLPDSVRAFIAEHHGTQPISFFLDRARELDPDGDVDTRDYTYPGPKPRTRETAIAMLADSVESAARVLQDPTPERIRALVDRIIEGKIAQGQLEDAPLTLRDLSLIRDEFVGMLTGMYHHRIDYPAPAREPAAAQGGSPGRR